jgi:antitoxin (DNA-binding transcriptional repressor) of toxin-antitoxin stability system
MPKSTNRRNPHFPLREAKNRLSELVKRAAQGEQITITLHGEPRVQLSRVLKGSRLFKVDRKWLREMRVGGSRTPAEALIRADRDGRD